MTLGRLLDEDWSPGSTSYDSKLGIFGPTRHSLKKAEGLKVELMTAHAHAMWGIIRKNPQSTGFRELLGW